MSRTFRPYVSSLALLIVAIVSGCTSSVTQVYNQNCTPVPTPCAPGTYNTTTLDTTFHGPGTVQNHITVVPNPYSTDAQDFAVTFVEVRGTELSLVTSNRSSSDGGSVGAHDGLWAYVTRTGRAVAISGLDSTSSVGAACYSSADHRLYFAARSSSPDPDDYDLFSAALDLTGNVLTVTDIRPLAQLNERDKFDSQPAIDRSGTMLVFVSDRSGGLGGTDLWISRRASTRDEWGAPSLLDGPINTACDELSPYFSADGMFYFASNGHATAGGYDLFSSSYNKGGFSEPQNLGRPINTEFDELFPVKISDTNFYWSSNRTGGPLLRNIYTITRTGIGRIAVNPTVPTERPVVQSVDTLPKGPVDLYVDVTRGADNRPAVGTELFVRHDSVELYRAKSPTSGKFKIKLNRDVYDVGAQNSESFFDVKHVDLRSIQDSTLHITLNLPDTLVLRINFPFDDYQHPYEFVIGDDGKPSTMTWKTALDLTAQSTLRSLKSLKRLVVIGHTDSLGSDAYNDKLGLHRAQFVASELIKRGVPEKLLSVSSRGRMQPVAIRPGESDEEFRLRSRRVEFVKVF